MTVEEFDIDERAGVIEPVANSYPVLQWMKDDKEILEVAGAGEVTKPFRGFAITHGKYDDVDAALTQAATRYPQGKFWRVGTIQFDKGNRERMWLRGGIEVIPVISGVQTLKDPGIRLGSESELLIKNPNAAIVERLGAVIGWVPYRDKAGVLKWKTPTTPDYRSIHRLPVLLKELPEYNDLFMISLKSTLTDNMIEALLFHSELRKLMFTRPAVLEAIKAQQLEYVDQQGLTGDDRAATLRKFPLTGFGMILGDGGVQDKGKTQTKTIPVLANIHPADITDDWLLRRMVTVKERWDADALLDITREWSTTVTREAVLLSEDERAEVLRRRAGQSA